ncbi:MAG: MarR family winged helix-turn-helix transcriptional regulator [Helicobacteraceae bacterium]|jgi:DNA-binding MarR family transcriptional regulator|nr:MarR family winged helix-turn-helix transcriptional regulator [Helicobacteraceae bacterium]
MNKRKVTELFERNRNVMHKLAEKMNLSFGQHPRRIFSILERLSEKGKMRLKDIAADLEMSSSSLCVLFSQMEKKGLIVREIDQSDRRNTFYSVSQGGEEVRNEMMEQLRVRIMKLFEPLSAGELQEVCDAMGVVNRILEKHL